MLERICADMKIICCATKTVRAIEAVKKLIVVAAVLFALCECIRLMKNAEC